MPDEPAHAHPSFANVIRQRERVRQRLGAIRHKIGVYSAKGGVGKTTIAVNTAYALARQGFRVGLLDADIDCPNVTMFLGIKEMMGTGFPLKPVVRDGVKVASTAMLIDELRRPIIWRGPIITKMLGELLENTDWGELDYLVFDLPPGTSDAPLTIMQLLALDGFIIVTTPQRIASINSIRSGLMARRLNVPLLGVVENMAGESPGANLAEVISSLGTDLLASVPLDPVFNTLSDSGKVPAIEDEKLSKIFRDLARRISGAVGVGEG